MANIIQYFTYDYCYGLNSDAVNNQYYMFVDIRGFYRYTSYYNQFLTIEDQVIKNIDGTNQNISIISYATFDEANLQKFQDFIAECADFNLNVLTINEALASAKEYSPARTVKDKTWSSKTFSEYVINQQGILEQTIS